MHGAGATTGSRFSFDALSSRSESFPSDQPFGKESAGLCLYNRAKDYLKRFFGAFHAVSKCGYILHAL